MPLRRRILLAQLIGWRCHEGRLGDLPTRWSGHDGGRSVGRARRVGLQLLPTLEILTILLASLA
jgi:hypothetical protein